MSVIVARRSCYRVAICIALASLLVANTTQAEEAKTPAIDSRVQKIPVSPLHEIAADGGILSVTQSQLVCVGNEPSTEHHYLTLVNLPTGETLEKVRIASPIEDKPHATASRDGSRIAILQENAIEIRDVSSLREVANRIPVDTANISSIALSNDGKQLAVGSRKSVTLYTYQTGERLHRFAIDSEQPLLIFSDLNQLGAFDATGVWLSESTGKPPEQLFRIPAGFALQKACISNNHCFASLRKLRSGDLVTEILSGNYKEEPYFVTKFDKRGNAKWQVGASNDSMAVVNDTVVFCNKQLLMRATDSTPPEVIDHCEWLRELSFSAGGDFLVGLVHQRNGVQVWNAKGWKAHSANAIPYGGSASAIDDNGRVTVTSQSSVCVADLGKPFQRWIDLPDDISPYMGKHWLSGDGRLLAWITKSDGAKLMDLVENKEIKIETRDDAKATDIWLNESGDRAIIRYQRKVTTPGQAAQRGFFEGFFGSSAASETVPADLISLPTGSRVAEFNTSDLELLQHPIFPGERMSYSTMNGIAHYLITPTKVSRTGSIRMDHFDQSMSASGTLVVGATSGKFLRYKTPTSPPQTLMQTKDDHILTVGISPDGNTTYCCAYDHSQRQTLLTVISSPDTKILWEQWLPSAINKLQVSPQGKHLLLTMDDGWYIVRTDF